MENINTTTFMEDAVEAERKVQRIEMCIGRIKGCEQKRKSATTEGARTRWQTEERIEWNTLRAIAHSLSRLAGQNIRVLLPQPEEDDEDNQDRPF